MRASTAFFVGIGTVGLAITGGLGGGLLIGNMMSPSPPKHAAEAARLDRPNPEQPKSSPSMAAVGALPYAAATLAFTDPSIDGGPPQAEQRADSSNVSSPTSVPGDQEAKPANSAAARQPMQEAQPAPSAKQASAPEDANAKAHDSDLKHAADRRRGARAQRWADRHRRDQDQNSDQQARDARNDSDGSQRYSYTYSGRRYRDAERGDGDDRAPSYYVDEAPRLGFPRVQLFGPDD